uniref:Uncharacterized protein n=1 Tax=Physcomitrium patens TaxID=3218 RepID=A0A2K1ILM4_PHYPA|nr:hypothetical protein PHYPA_026506 [Physcomitrium patens]
MLIECFLYLIIFHRAGVSIGPRKKDRSHSTIIDKIFNEIQLKNRILIKHEWRD